MQWMLYNRQSPDVLELQYAYAILCLAVLWRGLITVLEEDATRPPDAQYQLSLLATQRSWITWRWRTLRAFRAGWGKRRRCCSARTPTSGRRLGRSGKRRTSRTLVWRRWATWTPCTSGTMYRRRSFTRACLKSCRVFLFVCSFWGENWEGLHTLFKSKHNVTWFVLY